MENQTTSEVLNKAYLHKCCVDLFYHTRTSSDLGTNCYEWGWELREFSPNMRMDDFQRLIFLNHAIRL